MCQGDVKTNKKEQRAKKIWKKVDRILLHLLCLLVAKELLRLRAPDVKTAYVTERLQLGARRALLLHIQQGKCASDSLLQKQGHPALIRCSCCCCLQPDL